MKKVLEVKNVSKIYKIYDNNFNRLKEVFSQKKYHKEFISNKDISFDLYEGETLGIIGLNGAGKSTILKQIAGVIESTSGKILRYGRVTALLELGTGFNSQLTGYENIFLNGTLIGMTRKECEKKVSDIIAFSELGDYIYEPIKTYSSGMRMRLAFSIAIYSEPKILIVDEALSVGDAHFTHKCTKALKDRKQKNMSIIYVSHSLNSLKLLCDRMILLNKGEIIEEGSPEKVINKYNFLISKLNDSKEKILINNIENNSFGNFDAEIISTKIVGKESKSNIIKSGENTDLLIEIKSRIFIKNITVGIRIKDKFGQDIFGTNTFHHNMSVNFLENSLYLCSFSIPMNLGIGKYIVSVALHSGKSHNENCMHFIENACTFEINSVKGFYFIGLCNLPIEFSMKEVK